jgi:isoleucyl-tRNA synthetase
MAPFTPFASEDIWQKLKNEEDKESVHLVDWIKESKYDVSVLTNMNIVRMLISLGLQERQIKNIKIKQPLSKFTIKYNNKMIVDYLDLIQDELNVEEALFIYSDEQKVPQVELDVNITEELKQKGNYRELVRAIQDMRKKAGLNPNDIITLEIEASVDGEDLINKFKGELLKSVGAKDIQIKDNSGTEIKINSLVFVVNLVK